MSAESADMCEGCNHGSYLRKWADVLRKVIEVHDFDCECDDCTTPLGELVGQVWYIRWPDDAIFFASPQTGSST